jgi:predicted TIM-barrel fold metal-dependent hydrolase
MDNEIIIDADSHVEEVDETWDYLDEPYQQRRPQAITLQNRPVFANRNACWYIDGAVYPKVVGRGITTYGTPITSAYAQRKSFSLGSQGMTEPEARVLDLDRQGIDMQVIYHTIFLEPLTDDPEFEAALMRSYNTWMAKACAHNPKRLKWAAPMPLRNVPAAVKEASRAKELGATALTIAGTVGDRMLHDLDFDPFFSEAERLNMPISVHISWSHPGLRHSVDSVYGANCISINFTVLMGFFSFLGDVLDRHPRLKVTFLEAGSEWIPYMVHRMDHYYEAEKKSGWPIPKRPASAYLRECQIYFTCEADEKLLPEVLSFVGEDRIMISADIPHSEGRETSIEEIRERKDISDAAKKKILGLNAKAFYNL